MRQILIDTDVILDFFFDRQPFADSSSSVISLCESKLIEGYITPVICSNLYYLLRKTASHNKVIDKLKKLSSILGILPMDRNIVIQALNSEFKDSEDALQNFAAKYSSNVDVILTRNVKDYSKSDIGVLTPESYLKYIIDSH